MTKRNELLAKSVRIIGINRITTEALCKYPENLSNDIEDSDV